MSKRSFHITNRRARRSNKGARILLRNVRVLQKASAWNSGKGEGSVGRSRRFGGKV